MAKRRSHSKDLLQQGKLPAKGGGALSTIAMCRGGLPIPPNSASQRTTVHVAELLGFSLDGIGAEEARTLVSEEHRALGYRPPAGSIASEAQAAASKHPEGTPGIPPPPLETLQQVAKTDAKRLLSEAAEEKAKAKAPVQRGRAPYNAPVASESVKPVIKDDVAVRELNRLPKHKCHRSKSLKKASPEKQVNKLIPEKKVIEISPEQKERSLVTERQTKEKISKEKASAIFTEDLSVSIGIKDGTAQKVDRINSKKTRGMKGKRKAYRISRDQGNPAVPLEQPKDTEHHKAPQGLVQAGGNSHTINENTKSHRSRKWSSEKRRRGFRAARVSSSPVHFSDSDFRAASSPSRSPKKRRTLSAAEADGPDLGPTIVAMAGLVIDHHDQVEREIVSSDVEECPSPTKTITVGEILDRLSETTPPNDPLSDMHVETAVVEEGDNHPDVSDSSFETDTSSRTMERADTSDSVEIIGDVFDPPAMFLLGHSKTA